MWLDYVADVGDGWNSTYTVARLLATEELKLDWDGEAHATQMIYSKGWRFGVS